MLQDGPGDRYRRRSAVSKGVRNTEKDAAHGQRTRAESRCFPLREDHPAAGFITSLSLLAWRLRNTVKGRKALCKLEEAVLVQVAVFACPRKVLWSSSASS